MKHVTILAVSLLILTAGLGMTTQALADHSYRGHAGTHHGMDNRGQSWKQDLKDKQRQQIDKLRLDFKKKKYLLKPQIKRAKVELAMLVTSASPKQADIDKKIAQIVKLKSEIMKLKATHKINVRKVLTEEQRVLFDTHVLKKAYRGKHKGHRY